MKAQCYHCGNDCDTNVVRFDEKKFCCNGCKTVYQIFSENDLTCYYELQNAPGLTPKEIDTQYDFLDNPKILEKLLEFNDDRVQIINLYIPHIHCSSCIWVLENIHKLEKSVSSCQVNFPKKRVRITYDASKVSLKRIVELLTSIGYEPYISLDDYQVGQKKVDRSLIYKLGLAGFSFGNVMLLSFPEYFEVSEYWLDIYKHVFRWMMFVFSIPVVFYAAQDYYVSAWKGIYSRILNIDVPIALGISVLFIRSSIDIILDLGSGFFDSLTGLVFFLLLGKFFQQKTYNYLSFERDYKSYFPIAVTKILPDGKEENTEIYKIVKGDRLLIRNQELIPVDGVLIKGDAQLDYSFVTGEAIPVNKLSGDKLFAGGKQLSGVIEMEVLKSVEQSYLTELWSNDVFKKDKTSSFKTLTDSISKHFTITVLLIAFLATFFWIFYDITQALNVFTAVLIIACPCAIALAAPFTLGNILRIFGKKKFYLKNATIIEQISKIDTIIFDKTGTLTTNCITEISYQGEKLFDKDKVALKSVLRVSNHPLSRSLYAYFKTTITEQVTDVKEVLGKGIQASVNTNFIKIGSSEFVCGKREKQNENTEVYVSINNMYKGKFILKNAYRKGVTALFSKLAQQYDLAVLSGDNASEKEFLQNILPEKTQFFFNQKPKDKLSYVGEIQKKYNKNVMMIGDGLNDAGALAQSNVGIVISENINVFSPACDAILDASKFEELFKFINISKKALQIIRYCFVLSLMYNAFGMYFAITGQLKPVIAAILMPLSSISIVVFTTVMTNILGKKIK